ncbi:DUF5041 domain-containing protein [Mariniflexile aquimaris]|uniref:DUF5041 domain-containing protein n=1 Tax=Mariniflexile aquimaris TaxID=881009 RepID=A0ABW3BWF4_9FLAO
MENYNFKNDIMKRIILIWIFFVSIGSSQAQKFDVDYSNPNVTMEDMNAVLKSLKINVLKFGLYPPDSLKYKVCLFQEEYADKELVNEEVIWCTSSPYHSIKNGERIFKPFDGARFIITEDDNDFLLNIRMGDFGIDEYKLEIDSIYSNKHASIPFKIVNTTLKEGKTPLLLIGSFWESPSKNGDVLLRFCMEKELATDFSNQAFDMMPHYFIIGLNVTKQKEKED